MAKAKTIAKAKNDKPAKHPDAELIDACIDFSMALHAAHGAFEVDPTGDNDFAQARDTKLLRRADAASKAICDYLPSTLDGLRAKAETVKVGMSYDRGATEIAQSLVDDVARFHKAIVAGKSFATDAEIAS